MAIRGKKLLLSICGALPSDSIEDVVCCKVTEEAVPSIEVHFAMWRRLLCDSDAAAFNILYFNWEKDLCSATVTPIKGTVEKVSYSPTGAPKGRRSE